MLTINKVDKTILTNKYATLTIKMISKFHKQEPNAMLKRQNDSHATKTKLTQVVAKRYYFPQTIANQISLTCVKWIVKRILATLTLS